MCPVSPFRRLLVALVLSALPRALAAHPLAPVLLELRELGKGRVAIAWKTPLLRPRGSDPMPVLPGTCSVAEPGATTREDTGVVTRWTARCDRLVGERVGIDKLTAPLTGLVRVALADGRVVQRVVFAGDASLTVPERPTRWEVIRSYVRLGVEHILTGPDHLLFVFGLLLLAGTARRVLGTVSAFTVGHSVTLSLAVLGFTAVSSRVIEVGIAASVLVLAIEVARESGTPTASRRNPWIMAFVFGLLHGLGFAGALREAGLPAGEVPLALLAFNTGIELGQVGFVLLVLSLRRVVRPVEVGLPAWVRRVPVYAMGILAAFWCFERAAVFWG